MPFLSRTQLIKLFQSSKFVPESKKGQNYIVDYALCRKIGTCAKGSEQYKCILEIGPGFGAFTDFLFPLSEKVCVIEKDPKSSQYLMDYYKSHMPTQVINSREIQFLGYIPLKTQLSIIEADFFEVPLPQADLIISNIPFVHVVEFLIKIIEQWHSQKALFIVQKEVMDHLAAQPDQPGYSLSSILIGFFFKSQILLEIPSKSFYPKPMVNSVLVELFPSNNFALDRVSLDDRYDFIQFLRSVMPFKQKHMINVVKLVQTQNPQFAKIYSQFSEAIIYFHYERKVLRELSPSEIYILMKKSKN
ncbi:rRNA adenine N-6-methyltransferase family protein [Candidatus Lokiarchaeum ossiferum]|uniref:rRNA adenine N-6-methyltransferase family protein n=1 Tax=Candidatus Lokiarchaeum ossiferum TaxID=2951803 RepID=UPI00352F5766